MPELQGNSFVAPECPLSCLIKSLLHLVYLFCNQRCLKSDSAHKDTLLCQTGCSRHLFVEILTGNLL